jgi:hypothetical protein
MKNLEKYSFAIILLAGFATYKFFGLSSLVFFNLILLAQIYELTKKNKL